MCIRDSPWIDQRREPHARVGGIGVQREPVMSSVGQGDCDACYVARNSEDDLIGAHVVVPGVRCQPHPWAQRRPRVATLRVMSVGGLHLEAVSYTHLTLPTILR